MQIKKSMYEYVQVNEKVQKEKDQNSLIAQSPSTTAVGKNKLLFADGDINNCS